MEYQYQDQVQAPVVMECVGVGPRFVALLIDSIILSFIAGILNAVSGPHHVDVLSSITGLSGLAYSGSITGLLGLAYFIVLEATQGATLGKMALGLRVVRQDGTPIGWSESIIRNLLSLIDSLFFYLIGVILIWTSPLKQRLGDKVAHTVVVRFHS